MDEIRVLNIEGNVLQSSFQIVDGEFKNLNITTTTSQQKNYKVQFPESKCPIGSIGSNICTNCDQLFGSERPFCDKSIICDYSHNEEGICRCSPGYTGVSCENPCPQSYYGYDCTENCGLCEFSPCNYITGSCLFDKCLSNFEDSRCKTPPYPILTNPPTITFLGNTYITIEIRNSAYYGMGIPLKFKVMYKQTNNHKTLKETKLYDFYHRSEITLNNLQSDTSYTIYIVLVTTEDKLYDGSVIPRTLAETTCTDLQEEDIIVTTTHSNAVLTFRDKSELCSAKNYQIEFLTNILDQDLNNQFYLLNLSSDTNYTLNIKNLKTGTVIHYNFRTNVEVSSRVLSVEIASFTATSLNVSWRKPLNPNGLIKYYQINFKHVRYLACNYSEISNENATTLQSHSTNIILENLIPFSEYIIDIAAVTVAAVGEVSQIRGNTTATDILDEIEIPKSVNVQLCNSTEAKITLEQAKCSLIKGDIDYYISARCTSDWCFNTILTLNSSYYFANKELTLTGLLPYTMYTIDIEVARKNNSVYKHVLEPVTFKTHPTVPNPVEFKTYEESENMFRIRIVPEYPPTGELDKYIVKYCKHHAPSYKGPENCTEKYFEPMRCKIWKKFNCIEISEHLQTLALYVIFVQARNKNVTELSYEQYQYRFTKISESSPPQELSHSWDNFYNVTLQWNHPDVTNGPLTKFIITIQKEDKTVCYSYDYIVTEETTTLTYKYKVPIENKDCYTSELNVTIQSFNIMEGGSATLIIYSPPEMPTLNSEPLIESVSNTTLTMTLSAKKIEFPKSFMYILLSDSNSKFKIGDVEDSLNNLIHFKTLSPPWRIAKYNLSTEVPMEKLIIGSHNGNNSLENYARSTTGITLCPNTSYTITILMYNEYQQLKRYQVYEITNSTSGTSISPNDSSYGPSCNPSIFVNGNIKRLEILEKKIAELEKLIHSISHSKYDMDPLLIFFKDMATTVKSFEPQLIIEAKSRVFSIINELENRSLESQPAIVEVPQQ